MTTTTTVRAASSGAPPSPNAPPNEAEEKNESAGEDFAALLAGSWFSLQEANKPVTQTADADGVESSPAATMINGASAANHNSISIVAPNLTVTINSPAGAAEVAAADEAALAALHAAEQNPGTISTTEGLSANAAPQSDAESIAALNQARNEAQAAQTQAHAAEKNFARQLTENVEAAHRDHLTLKSLHSEAAQRDSATVASFLAEATRGLRPALNASLLKPLLADRTPLAAEAEKRPIDNAPSAPEGTMSAAIPDFSAAARANVSGTEEVDAAAREVIGQVAEPVINTFEKLEGRESRTLNLRLRPDSLGQVEVQLTRDAGGNLSAHLVADHDEARRALHEGINHLRETLEQAGLNVTRLEVSVGGNQHFGHTGHQSSNIYEAPTAPLRLPRAAPAAETAIHNPTADLEDRVISLRA